jgi:SAM-dependent methyltransferase
MIEKAVSFAEYLEAKFDLDERSLNREVREAFWQALERLPNIECLDLGAGTGATARRLLSRGLCAPLSLTALDRDAGLLDIAREDAAQRLQALGLVTSSESGELHVEGDRPAAIRFVACELGDYRRERFCNVITAHAFLDLMPLPQTLDAFAAWLQPGGVLYASLNYDGDTALLPLYDDAGFETDLLSHYDDTMERRRVGNRATGGARCGRRLHRLLPDHGFEILACGSSDWNITPYLGRYRGGDALCLQALLDMIRAEAQRSDLFDRDQLAHWHRDRLRLLHERRLGMIVHQLDLLARYDPRGSPTGEPAARAGGRSA